MENLKTKTAIHYLNFTFYAITLSLTSGFAMIVLVNFSTAVLDQEVPPAAIIPDNSSLPIHKGIRLRLNH